MNFIKNNIIIKYARDTQFSHTTYLSGACVFQYGTRAKIIFLDTFICKAKASCNCTSGVPLRTLHVI